MSLMDATLIGVGAMIGAGIFVLTGIAAGVAGPALIVAFALNGVVALFTAMSYAELGSCFHDAGGGYLWVKEGLPRWNGFLSGWMSWFAHAVACSVYALGFAAYFDHVLHEFGASLPHWGLFSPQKILAVAIAVAFGYINYRGASETGKVGSMVTIAKIVILFVFIGFGLDVLFRKPDLTSSFTPFMPNGWGGVFSAMGLTFIAFEGYEVIAQASEEVRSPKRNIPKAVFLSLVIVIPIYLLVAVVALGTVHSGDSTPWDYLASHKELALVEVSQTFFVGGGVLLLVGGLISTMSALNATIYSSSRVAFAMGRDRNFPSFFSKVHKKKFTPHWAILVSLIIIVMMAVSLPIEDVASAADIMFLLLFLQVNLAMIRLRKRRPDLDRGYVTPFFPYISIFGIVLLLALALYMFNYSPIAWVVTIVWVIAGLFIYRTYAYEREVEHIRKVKALEALERKEYRILVPIANPVSMSSLAHTAIAIARKNDAEIIFLRVIEVREGQSLMAGLKEPGKASEQLEQMEDLVATFGIPVRGIVKVSHRISQAIVETATEENCNFIILGRHKNPTFLQRFFSSVIDTVIQESPCEVAVLHGEFASSKVKNILIPFGRNLHAILATEIAPAFAAHFGAKLQLTIVFEPGLPVDERNRLMKEANDQVLELNLPATVKPVYDMDVLEGVLAESRKADMIVMGGKTGEFVELLFGRSLTQEITNQSHCPVLWVKEFEEKESFWASLLKPFPKEVEHHE